MIRNCACASSVALKLLKNLKTKLKIQIKKINLSLLGILKFWVVSNSDHFPAILNVLNEIHRGKTCSLPLGQSSQCALDHTIAQILIFNCAFLSHSLAPYSINATTHNNSVHWLRRLDETMPLFAIKFPHTKIENVCGVCTVLVSVHPLTE